jgi:hypothetical protein
MKRPRWARAEECACGSLLVWKQGELILYGFVGGVDDKNDRGAFKSFLLLRKRGIAIVLVDEASRP